VWLPDWAVIDGSIAYGYFERLNGWVFQGFGYVHYVHVGFALGEDIEGEIFVVRRPDIVRRCP